MLIWKLNSFENKKLCEIQAEKNKYIHFRHQMKCLYGTSAFFIQSFSYRFPKPFMAIISWNVHVLKCVYRIYIIGKRESAFKFRGKIPMTTACHDIWYGLYALIWHISVLQHVVQVLYSITFNCEFLSQTIKFYQNRIQFISSSRISLQHCIQPISGASNIETFYSVVNWNLLKMSNEPDVIRFNGLKTLNGTTANGRSETKTPFLIGVAGGTASGKVSNRSLLLKGTLLDLTQWKLLICYFVLSRLYANGSWNSWAKLIWTILSVR